MKRPIGKNNTELQQIIADLDLNAQTGEMVRAIYRKGLASHSDALRDAKKVLFYAAAEVRRLEALEQTRDEREFPLVAYCRANQLDEALKYAPDGVQVVCITWQDGLPSGRMTWQDVAKLSAVHRVFIRDCNRWLEVKPYGQTGQTLMRGDVDFDIVGECDGHKADV